MTYAAYVGIDYSGKGSPRSKFTSIQLFEATAAQPPTQRQKSWSRQALHQWLDGRLALQQRGEYGPMLIGIDHGLSFPLSYFDEHGLDTYDAFLDHIDQHWGYSRLEPLSSQTPSVLPYRDLQELRMCEKFSSSAKSVLNLNPNMITVAFSTHTGLPWLIDLRRKYSGLLHFWPYDGLQPRKGASVIAEAYPAIYYHRYKEHFPSELSTRDAQDAYSITAWLRDQDQKGKLKHYFSLATLDDQELAQVTLEGWILGIL